MRIAFVNLTACGLLLICHQLAAQKPEPLPERNRIAPASDGVEIEQIEIVRRNALGAAKGADITNMHIKLWFSGSWKKKEAYPHLIRFHSLSSIEDDTGRLLSTETRLKYIEYLRGEVRGNSWRQDPGGKEGPIAEFMLEAPARKADKIKAIKGKAEICLAKAVVLKFDDLSAINGKELEHPDMAAVKNLKLRFSIEMKDGSVLAKMSAPVDFVSRGRLDDWALMDGKKEIRLSIEGVNSKGEGVTEEKTYRRRNFKGWSLRLVVLEPVECKTFNFEFRDIKLP